MNNLFMTVASILTVLIVSSCSTVKQDSSKIHTEKFQSVLKVNFPKFKECYKQQKLKQKNKESVVVFDFTIASDGKAKDAKVIGEGFAVDKNVESCMNKELENIQFEKPMSEGGFDKIKQPVVFQN